MKKAIGTAQISYVDFYSKELQFLRTFSDIRNIDFSLRGNFLGYLELLKQNGNTHLISGFIMQMRQRLIEVGNCTNALDTISILSIAYSETKNKNKHALSNVFKASEFQDYSPANKMLATVIYARSMLHQDQFDLAFEALSHENICSSETRDYYSDYCELITISAMESGRVAQGLVLLLDISKALDAGCDDKTTAEVNFSLASLYFHSGNISECKRILYNLKSPVVDKALRNKIIIFASQVDSFETGNSFIESICQQDELSIVSSLNISPEFLFVEVCLLIQQGKTDMAAALTASLGEKTDTNGRYRLMNRLRLLIQIEIEELSGNYLVADALVREARFKSDNNSLFMGLTGLPLLLSSFALGDERHALESLSKLASLRRQLQIRSFDSYFVAVLSKAILLESELLAVTGNIEAAKALLKTHIDSAVSSSLRRKDLLRMKLSLARLHIGANENSLAENVVASCYSQGLTSLDEIPGTSFGFELGYIELLLDRTSSIDQKITSIDGLLGLFRPDARAYTDLFVDLAILRAEYLCSMLRFQTAHDTVLEVLNHNGFKSWLTVKQRMRLEGFIGSALVAQHKYGEAYSHLSDVTAKEFEFFQNASKESFRIRFILSESLMLTGESRQAMELFRKLRSDITKAGNRHVDIGYRATLAYATCLEILGSYAGAAFNFATALDMQKLRSDLSLQEQFTCIRAVAWNQEMAGNLDKAATAYADALSIAEGLKEVSALMIDALRVRLHCCLA